MTPVSTSILIDALRWRYATKKFDSERKVPAGTWEALEQALVLAPSSHGLQPWKFIVVQDAAVRAKLAAASWGQKQPVECSHFVVFAGATDVGSDHVDRHHTRAAEVRGVTKESLQRYVDSITGNLASARANGTLDNWMHRQVYIALGQFMAAAALLGVDTCPMEGLEPPKYDEILGLKALGYTTLCACAAGYRAADDKHASYPKVRFKESEVIVHV
jgi:nitroreductase